MKKLKTRVPADTEHKGQTKVLLRFWVEPGKLIVAKHRLWHAPLTGRCHDMSSGCMDTLISLPSSPIWNVHIPLRRNHGSGLSGLGGGAPARRRGNPVVGERRLRGVIGKDKATCTRQPKRRQPISLVVRCQSPGHRLPGRQCTDARGPVSFVLCKFDP